MYALVSQATPLHTKKGLATVRMWSCPLRQDLDSTYTLPDPSSCEGAWLAKLHMLKLGNISG